MAVTTQQVIDDTSLYIPSQNIISEADMLALAQKLIDKYGDSDENLPKIECEFLKGVGVINSVSGAVSSGGLKREKLGDHEIEYFDGATQDWDGYIKKVKEEICPLLGVTSKVTIGAKFNSAPEVSVIKPCVNPDWIL